MNNDSIARFLSRFLIAILTAAPAFAIDGVILIDQNKALAGSVTSGDLPGFPVTITAPGSYKLSANLTVPNADTTAVDVRAPSVTLDLNGFSISGSIVCPERVFNNDHIDCAIGTGIGVRGLDTHGTTVQNGTIRGFGLAGVWLGANAIVQDLQVYWIGGRYATPTPRAAAISIADGIVRRNTVRMNGSTGIVTLRGLVTDNAVSFSRIGVVASGGSLVKGNSITRNVSFGLGCSVDGDYDVNPVGYSNNVIQSNANSEQFQVIRMESSARCVDLGSNQCGTIEDHCP